MNGLDRSLKKNEDCSVPHSRVLHPKKTWCNCATVFNTARILILVRAVYQSWYSKAREKCVWDCFLLREGPARVGIIGKSPIDQTLMRGPTTCANFSAFTGYGKPASRGSKLDLPAGSSRPVRSAIRNADTHLRPAGRCFCR